VVGTLRPGRYPVYGTTHLRWWVGDLFLRLGQHTVWSPLAETRLAPWLLTTLGGHVDPTSTAPVGGRLTSISAIDADLLDIGAHAHIRRTARVRAHMFLDGELVLSPVTVRDGGVVWSRALVEPGARVSQGAMLDAHAVLVMGHEVPEDTTWSGIPASAARARPGPAPLQVDPQERRATLLCGLVLAPSVAMAVALSWWGVITAMIPGVSLSGPDIRVWLAAYPAWLLVTWLGALGVVCVKWAALGRLEPGTAEDDHPVALPLVRALTGMVALVSPLWPSALRWGYASILGARVSPHAITEEPFLDLAYADLYTRASGSFFSPAAFAEFAHPEDGRRVLQPIELVQGSYVGAYSTVVAPLQTQPQSMLAGCSHLPAGEEMTGSAAWVGVPARAVPIRPGEATQDAFRVPHTHLRAVRWLTDLLRIAVFLVGMGIVWAAGLVASGGGFVAGLAGLGTLLAATWAIFVPLLWLQGREIKRQLRADPVLERDGIARQSPLFAVWGSTLLTMLPVALTTDMLSGTPLRSVLLRLLGARIGARVYVDQGVALSELPFIDIADDAVINEGAALIAHSEQPDGRVSFKTLHLGAQSSVLWSGYLVGGTHLPDRAVLGSLSRPFDGQQLEADREYDNTPCRAQDGG
jgi:non-ribosomal peptide synthetase-like protein